MQTFHMMDVPLDIYAAAFIGGVSGAVLMDKTEELLARRGLRSGVTTALVGRWALGLLRGQWRHGDIRYAKPQPREAQAGWWFHFIVGGGLVATAYPLVFDLSSRWMLTHHLLSGLLFGLATCLLPWFVLFPSFGWGALGRRGPEGAKALMASLSSHLPYGLGVAVVVAMRMYSQ